MYQQKYLLFGNLKKEVQLTGIFKAFINEQFKESFDITFMKNRKNCQKIRLCLVTVFVFYFQKLVYGNIKKKQFFCIFEIKNMFG